MTILQVYQKDSLNIGFDCSGHSGYGEEGSDIVCAAVSTAVQYCVNCCEKIDNIPINLEIDEDTASIRCFAKKPDQRFSSYVDILIDLGQSIADSYAMYFNLEIMEV